MYIPLLQSLGSPHTASSASSPTTSSSSSPTGGTAGLDTMFLKLLSAQLQSQSPINPLDPNQFVAQLAQFQSLSELTQIDQLMQTLVNNTSGAPSPSGGATPATVTSSSSIPSTSLNSVSH